MAKQPVNKSTRTDLIPSGLPPSASETPPLPQSPFVNNEGITANGGGGGGAGDAPVNTPVTQADKAKGIMNTTGLNADERATLISKTQGNRDVGGLQDPNTQAMMAQQTAQQQMEDQFAQEMAQKSGVEGMVRGPNGDFIDGKGSSINWKQVGLSTVGDASVWGKVAGFASAGAGLGIFGGPAAPLTVTSGALIGAFTGLLIGAGASVMSNIKSQKTDELNAQKIILSTGQTNLNKLTLLMQTDPSRAPQYIDAYNQQMDKISEAYSTLKADTKSNLNLVTEQDGTTQLARFGSFYAPGGARDYYNQKMQLAIITPNPQNALMELAISQQNMGVEDGQAN